MGWSLLLIWMGLSTFFTPESVLDIQEIIGADIVMPLDECVSLPAEHSYVRKSIQLTHKWLKTAKEYHDSKPNEKKQQLFGIIQVVPMPT